MEPLPLIPRIQNVTTPEIGYLVREVFQNVFQSVTANWRISTNLSKSCSENEDLRQIAAQMKAVNINSFQKILFESIVTSYQQQEIIEHKETLEDIEFAEMQIMESHGYQLCRDQRMTSNERAMELIRLKRHPLYIDLHPNIIERYHLLQSDDLLPPMHERVTGSVYRETFHQLLMEW